MASFITVCHKKMASADIGEVIQIYLDRLQNELTRDATLKALTKIALNQEAPASAPAIEITNLAVLLPRLYDLLHKTQRSLHLNTLEALVAMVERYSSQFTSHVGKI
jgi:hypothetical protein